MRIVISVEERLSALFDKVTNGRATEQDTVRELRALRLDTSDPNRIEKLRDAIMWSEIYFSSRKWNHGGLGKRSGISSSVRFIVRAGHNSWKYARCGTL